MTRPLHAAVYARLSKERDQIAADAKSVTRQVDNAKAFATAQAGRVSDSHVFVDDGISGAEFKKRPGFQRLMAMLPTPPFSVLIVSEQKSIGRESSEVSYTIKQLAQAGVEIFEYGHGKSLTPKSALDKVLSVVQGFGDEAHREATSERVHEAHTRLAKAGHVTGGRVFGYRNHDVYHGDDAHGRPLRSHVERVIEPTEAAVVRRIFTLYDSGLGLKRIAKTLNAEHAASPTPFKRERRLVAHSRLVAGHDPDDPRARDLPRRHRLESIAQTPGHVGPSRPAASAGLRASPHPGEASASRAGSVVAARPVPTGGSRAPRDAVREWPLVRPSADALHGQSAGRLGDVFAVSRWSRGGDQPAQARPGAGICLPSPSAHWHLPERPPHERRRHARGRAARRSRSTRSPPTPSRT